MRFFRITFRGNLAWTHVSHFFIELYSKGLMVWATCLLPRIYQIELPRQKRCVAATFWIFMINHWRNFGMYYAIRTGNWRSRFNAYTLISSHGKIIKKLSVRIKSMTWHECLYESHFFISERYSHLYTNLFFRHSLLIPMCIDISIVLYLKWLYFSSELLL